MVIEAAQKMKAKANEAHKSQLLSMGFPDWLVDEALKATTGLEPAINWITEQLSKGGGGGNTYSLSISIRPSLL